MPQPKCPCGSGQAFRRCCQPILRGESAAPTPVALVRARYTAFTRLDMDFLERTHDPRTFVQFDVDENRRWAEANEFRKLEILRAETAPDGEHAAVEFRAEYRSPDGMTRHHHEISALRKSGGCWLFVDGRAGGR